MTTASHLRGSGAPGGEVVIVTGMSGAGRSTAGNALEDIGYYVVDNLPPQMLEPLIELATAENAEFPRIAAIVDIRGGSLFGDLVRSIASARLSTNIRVLFLDATDETLIRRFEAVRRPHPLQGSGTIIDGIQAERARVEEVRELSDLVFDTSSLNIHQLSTKVFETFADENSVPLHVTLQSFGFKYGIPTDGDIVTDARFLPNPFWQPELKLLTGLDAPVSEYVLGQQGAREYLDGLLSMLRPVFGGYLRENKRYATVSIGCTGGMHRSVALVMELATLLSEFPEISVTIKHRDLAR